jgi:hypothetical protein
VVEAVVVLLQPVQAVGVVVLQAAVVVVVVVVVSGCSPETGADHQLSPGANWSHFEFAPGLQWFLARHNFLVPTRQSCLARSLLLL